MGNKNDFLAVILIGAGSCWGRAPDKKKAIKNALHAYKRDAGSIFKIKRGDEVVVNVVNVAPHDSVWWDNSGIWAGETKLDRTFEHVHATVP